MKLINKLSYMFFIGFGLAAFSLTAMEEQDDLSFLVEEIDSINVDGVEDEPEPVISESINTDDLITELKFAEKFDIKNPGEGFIVRSALKSFEEAAQDYNGKSVMTLKELAARYLLGQPINLETLKSKLPTDLIEYLERLITSDQKMLPLLVKKLKNGAEGQRKGLIAKCSRIFYLSEFRSSLVNFSENDQNQIMSEIQLFFKITMEILRAGTLKDINEILIFFQDCFNALLNCIRYGEIDISAFRNFEIFSFPFSRQELVQQIINMVKNEEMDLEQLRSIANDTIVLKVINKLMDKTRKELNFVFEAEKQLGFIFQNKNIDINHKYKDETALEWANENNNDEISSSLINLGAIQKPLKSSDIYQLLMLQRHRSIMLSLFIFSCFFVVQYIYS